MLSQGLVKIPDATGRQPTQASSVQMHEFGINAQEIGEALFS